MKSQIIVGKIGFAKIVKKQNLIYKKIAEKRQGSFIDYVPSSITTSKYEFSGTKKSHLIKLDLGSAPECKLL